MILECKTNYPFVSINYKLTNDDINSVDKINKTTSLLTKYPVYRNRSSLRRNRLSKLESMDID